MNKEIKDIRIVFSIFTLIFSLLFYKNYTSNWSLVFAFLAIILVVLIVFSPLTLKPLFNGWLKLAHLLGKINTTIILTVLFLLVFIPIGLIMKLIGKDPLKKKKESVDTYWEEYKLSGLINKDRYERQF